MRATDVFEYEWDFLASFLPAEDYLIRTATETGAILRKRNVHEASTLLRLALAYGFCSMSLRQTAAWAQAANVAILSNVALLKRLRASADWLGHLLALKLAERAPPPSLQHPTRRLRLVDATTISRPGSTGTDWRVHLGFDLAALRIDHVHLTDASGGETLRRFPCAPGEIVCGDRGYSHRPGLHSVLTAGADFLVRLNWQTLPLQDPTGEPFRIPEALRALDPVQPGEFPVLIAPSPKDGIPAVPARLLVVRKSEHAAAQSREKALRERAEKRRGIDPRTLEAAEFIMVLTSVATDLLSTAEGLEVFRFRWQIELAFKRLKSLLELDRLPAKDPPLARSILYAKLLGALLLDDLTNEFLAFSPWGHRLRQASSVGVAHSVHAG
jgi:hypothetical protein